MRKSCLVSLIIPMVRIAASCSTGGSAPSQAEPVSPQPGTNSTGLPLTIPDGFSISIFADNLGSPRVIAWDPDGVMLVSVPSAGRIVALPDGNADGVADR